MMRDDTTKPVKMLALALGLTLGLIAGTTTPLAAATFNFNLAFVTEEFPNVPDPFGMDQPARASGTISFNDMPTFGGTFGPTITSYSGVGTEFTFTVFDAFDNALGSFAGLTPFDTLVFDNSDQTTVVGETDGFSFATTRNTGTGAFANISPTAVLAVFLPTDTFDDQGFDNVTLDNIALSSARPDILTDDGLVPAVSLFIEFDDTNDFALFGGPIAPVPVPASLPLMVGGLGLFAMAARRRRQRLASENQQSQA